MGGNGTIHHPPSSCFYKSALRGPPWSTRDPWPSWWPPSHDSRLVSLCSRSIHPWAPGKKTSHHAAIQSSGQIKKKQPPRFPWNKGISLTKPPFGVRSFEVAIWNIPKSLEVEEALDKCFPKWGFLPETNTFSLLNTHGWKMKAFPFLFGDKFGPIFKRLLLLVSGSRVLHIGSTLSLWLVDKVCGCAYSKYWDKKTSYSLTVFSP